MDSMLQPKHPLQYAEGRCVFKMSLFTARLVIPRNFSTLPPVMIQQNNHHENAHTLQKQAKKLKYTNIKSILTPLKRLGSKLHKK